MKTISLTFEEVIFLLNAVTEFQNTSTAPPEFQKKMIDTLRILWWQFHEEEQHLRQIKHGTTVKKPVRKLSNA
jgi:hypothetical protein